MLFSCFDSQPTGNGEAMPCLQTSLIWSLVTRSLTHFKVCRNARLGCALLNSTASWQLSKRLANSRALITFCSCVISHLSFNIGLGLKLLFHLWNFVVNTKDSSKCDSHGYVVVLQYLAKQSCFTVYLVSSF